MENSLNILIVHNKYHFRGGEDTVVEQDTKLLEKYGHHVFHYYRTNDELQSFSLFKKLCLPFTVFFSFKSYHEVQDLITKHHIDIVHVHNTFLVTSFSVYYAAKAQKKCLIQTIHNFRLVCPNALLFRDGHTCEDCISKSLLSSIKHKCYRNSRFQTLIMAFALFGHRLMHTFRLPDAYITMTEFNMKKLNSIIPSEKFFFKPNYLEMEPPTDLDLPEYPYFLYVSRVERVKGVFTTLEAFSNLKNQHLIIIGSGPDEEEVKQYINLHHMHNVTLLGQQNHNNTLTYMKHAQALIFPSLLYEGGFPLTIIESFSVATPVIVSDSPNISQNIKEEYNGFLFKTGNAESLTSTISQYVNKMSDSSFSQTICNNCYRYYTENYTEESVYRKMIEIYNTAIANSQDTI